MTDIKITRLIPANEHGQQICTVTTKITINGVAPGVHTNFVADPRDPHGLGPTVTAMLLAGKRSYNFPKGNPDAQS